MTIPDVLRACLDIEEAADDRDRRMPSLVIDEEM
jgi:hypothetical protein